MPNKVLTVTINPAIDCLQIVSSRGLKESLSAGGKGINVSRALNFFRIYNTATGILGGSRGAAFHKMLRAEKIRADFFNITKESRVNLTRVYKNRTKVERKISLGPGINTQELNGFKRKYQKLLKRSLWVVIAGRKAKGACDHLYAQLTRMAKMAGSKVVLDAADDSFYDGLKAKPFMIKPNLDELESFLGRKLRSIAQIKSVIQNFHRQGVEVVVVSMGAKGAIASDGKEMWQAIPPRLSVVNTVGCGDSLVAGFIYSYLKNKTLKEHIRTAVAAGCADALTIQPGLIRQKDFQKILKTIQLKKFC